MKESTATIWWCDCEGCAAVRFYVAVSDKQETSTAKNISEMNILTSCVVLSHLFTGCDQRSHPLTGFIFQEVKVTVHQSPQYHKCLSTGHCDTGQPFVSSDKHHSHPLCGFRKHNLGKKIWGNVLNSDFQYEISHVFSWSLSLLACMIKSSWAVLVASDWLNQSVWRSAVFLFWKQSALMSNRRCRFPNPSLTLWSNPIQFYL